MPWRNFYYLGGEVLAHELLGEERPGASSGCGGCAGVGAGRLRGGPFTAGLVLVAFLGGLGVRALRRGAHRRAGSFIAVAVRVLGGALGGASCLQVAPLAASRVYYHHNDFLGTPQRLSDHPSDQSQAPKVVWAVRYEPFGQVQIDDDPDGDGVTVDNPLRFPGQYDDRTKEPFGVGPYYNYHRYYDPAVGRYTQTDPQAIPLATGGAYPSGGGDFSYAYAANNPLVNVDPLGLYTSVGFPVVEGIMMDIAIRDVKRKLSESPCCAGRLGPAAYRLVDEATYLYRPGLRSLYSGKELCGDTLPKPRVIEISDVAIDAPWRCGGSLQCTILHEVAHLATPWWYLRREAAAQRTTFSCFPDCR